MERRNKKKKFKPFDITFNVRSIDEANILLMLFEGSPHLFSEVIEEIKEKYEKYS